MISLTDEEAATLAILERELTRKPVRFHIIDHKLLSTVVAFMRRALTEQHKENIYHD